MAAVTMTTIAIGAAIGAGVGAVATYAAGGRGDALWKGALTGAVGGAITGGVGSWASAAGYSAIASGAMAGAAGGIGAGALGTALSGGNSSDYLRNIATGGLAGAALGAAGGYMSGGESAATAGTSGIEGGVEAGSGLAGMDAGLETGGVQGLNTGATAAPGVEASVTGPTAATPSLSDTVSGLSQGGTTSALETGGAMAGGGAAPALSTTTAAPTTAPMASGGFGADTSPAAFDMSGGANFTSGSAPMGSTGSATIPEDNFWNNYFGDKSYVGSQMDAGTKGTGMGLEDYLKMQGKAQLLGGGVKALGALATAPETQQNRNQLMDLYNQQNAANQYYQNLMQQSYQNPQGYLGSPEAAATRSAALQKILASNAAAGRRTAGSAAYNQLMMNQLQNLGNYRRGIPQPQYGTAAQTLNYAQQYSPTADIFGGLASMATPLSLYSLFPG